MAHVKDIAITKGKIYRGGCHCRGVRFCLTGPLRQALICHCRACFQIAGLSWGSTSVAIGMLDDADDLVISGQIFADSHPHWDRLRTYDLPHLDDQFRGKKS